MKKISAVFINLDQSVDRRSDFEMQLRRTPIPFSLRRFKALTPADILPEIVGSPLIPSNAACYASHRAALAYHLNEPGHLLIMEDDVQLASSIGSILPRFDTALTEPWDIVYLDLSIVTPEDMANFFWLSRFKGTKLSNELRFHSLSKEEFAGCHAYIINEGSKQKCKLILDKNWPPRIPVDLLYRDMIHRGHLKAMVTIPYLTRPSAYSTTSTRVGSQPPALSIIDGFRRLMFLECSDSIAIHDEAEKIRSDQSIDSDVLAFEKLIGYLFTPGYFSGWAEAIEKTDINKT